MSINEWLAWCHLSRFRGGGAPVPSPSPIQDFRGKGYLDIFNTTPPGSASMNEYDATLVSANRSFPYQLLAVSGSICELTADKLRRGTGSR